MASQRDDYLIRISVAVKNDKALLALTKELEKTTKAAKKVDQAMPVTGKRVGAFGKNINNVSFQLQDFIVQTTGGTSALRALSQQLPQALIGFGKYASIIGVLVSALPVLNALLAKNARQFKTLDETITELNEGLSETAQISTAVDFSSWTNAFKQMDEQAKLLASSILDVRIQVQEINFEAAIESFTGFVDVIVPGTKLADVQLASIAKNLGITAGELEQLIPLINQFRDDPFGDPALLEEIVSLLKNAGAEALPVLERLNALKQAQEALQAGRTAASTAGTGPGSGLSEVRKELEALEEITVRAQKQNYDYPMMAMSFDDRAIIEGFQETQNALNDFSNNFVQEFDLMSEAASIFESSFDTAFNGVAMGTQDVSSAITNMVKTIIAQLGKLAALKGIEMLFPSLAGQLVTTSAKGNAFLNGSVTPFAKGGVVSSPTIFPMAKGVGLMGEAGSPEAIMPLTRTSSGNLGVEATGMNVTVNNMSPAQIRTTQTDSGVNIDVIMDTIASAVQRGGNNVADALESTYPISRGQRVY